MDVHEPAEGMREERGGPEKKRRFLDERLAGERRHQPVVRLEDLVDEAEAVGLIGLPRIVAEEARQDPRGDERADRRVALHAGSTTTLRSSSSSASASVSFSSSFCAQDSSDARLRLRMASAFW